MSHRVGGTSWRRFAAVLVPSVAACTGLGIAMAQGALAASFLISGQRFTVTADTLTARGVSIYSMVDLTKNHEPVPVVVTGLRHATIRGLCQSVAVDVPVLGTYTLRLTGGEGRPAEATNLFLDATLETAGQANFRDIDIGIAQGTITKGPVDPGDRNSQFFDPSGFGQQASSLTVNDLSVTVVAVSAATFDIPGLRLAVEKGSHECP
ncbi:MULTISPECIES: DUF6230 family protein [unclassified Streptomyces]|uniref:DUF6230 family protein n=1 Tax=unclassified Streptomyces TaxID=2593676 RepID=UPI0033C7D00F